MASILPRLAVILALVTGGGWAAAGSPAPSEIWSSGSQPAPVESAVEATPTPSVTDEIPFIEDGRHVNSVEAYNRRDGRFEFSGRADYVREKHDDVTAGNQAYAHATCRDCQTIALALQLVVYRQGANHVAPRNFAIAVNEHCTRCLTVARAIQYVIPVPDPKDVPSEVRELVRELNKELNEIERIRALNQGNVQDVDARLNAVITRFDSLRAFLRDDRQEAQDDSATPTPALSSSPTPQATVTKSPANTPAPLPATTPTPSPATNTPSPATPSPIATATSVPPTATHTPAPQSTATGPP